MERRAKIVVTLGPATEEQKTIERLLKAGVNVIRLNFSHGTHEEHAGRIILLRRVARELGLPITLMQDLQGPKIRTGLLKEKAVTVVQGEDLILTTERLAGDAHRVSVDFSNLPNSVRPGGRILLDDGNLELVVVRVEGTEVHTQVVLGGLLKEHKGVNLPGANLNIPSFTDKDEADLKFGLEQGIDAVAMSFVRRAEDVVRVRNAMAKLTNGQRHVPIIAKLERPEALENLEEIIEASDGVMVARGDLGVEMSPEFVPIAQKQIIEAANKNARIVITATQMLDSMITNPRPTRAEASDVANAIFDGTDAVMLSGETAIGKYPIQAVEMMDAIIRRAEAELNKWGHWRGTVSDCVDNRYTNTLPATHDDALSTTRAAAELAHDRNVAALAVFTETGRTAQLMSKTRPGVPILAFTPVESTYQQLPLLWGVVPYLVPYSDTLEAMLEQVEKALVTATPLQPGQQIVLISGFPVGARRPPNLALLYTIGEGISTA